MPSHEESLKQLRAQPTTLPECFKPVLKEVEVSSHVGKLSPEDRCFIISDVAKTAKQQKKNRKLPGAKREQIEKNCFSRKGEGAGEVKKGPGTESIVRGTRNKHLKRLKTSGAS